METKKESGLKGRKKRRMEFGKGKESWKKEKAMIENIKWKGRNEGEKE